MLDVDPLVFAGSYWAHRDAFDAGGSAEDYWRSVARQVGRPVQTDMIECLTQVDVNAWVMLHPESEQLLHDLHSSCTRVGLLSNAPHALASAVRAQTWAGLLDQLVFSADIGVCKPDVRAFARASALLGADASELLFFDDRPINVEGAHRAGWRAHVWQGHASARQTLVHLGVF